MKNAKSYFIVISVGFNSEFYKNASPLVASQIAFKNKTYISPQVVVVSADGNKFLGNVKGSATASKSGYKAVMSTVEKYIEDGTIPKQPTVFKWYLNSKGTYRNLPFAGLADDGFLLGTAGQAPQKIAFSKFQPGALKFAKRYAKYKSELDAKAKVEEVSKDFTYPETEEWISSKGKKLNARFVSLNENDELTLLVKKAGYSAKSYKMPLHKLDESSQEKAKKWKAILAEQNAKIEKAKKMN